MNSRILNAKRLCSAAMRRSPLGHACVCVNSYGRFVWSGGLHPVFFKWPKIRPRALRCTEGSHRWRQLFSYEPVGGKSHAADSIFTVPRREIDIFSIFLIFGVTKVPDPILRGTQRPTDAAYRLESPKSQPRLIIQSLRTFRRAEAP